jgi:hypothetical protein
MRIRLPKRAEYPNFPVFAEVEVCRMLPVQGVRAMSEKKESKPVVSWELVEDPNPEALSIALAMLFQRKWKPEEEDLTKPVEELRFKDQTD